jgi:hypothetical protein
MSRRPILEAVRPDETPPEAPTRRTSPSTTPRRSPSGGRWRWFVRPYEPKRNGTMPAGIVLVLMVATLFVAMFLNADATLRKSNSKDKGAWRQETAQAVASLSDAFGVSRLRRVIDDARGVSAPDDVVNTDQLLAEQQSQQQAVAPTPGSTLPPPARPTLRVPTPTDKLKFWVGGDSITGAFGPEMQKVVDGTGLFAATVDSKPSSGLTRPDYFNWPAHLVDVAKTQSPDVMVIMFGANDAQNMPIDGLPGGKRGYQLYDEDWVREYTKRVGATMDLLRSPTNDRQIIWVGAPPMGPNSGVRGMEKLDYIYWSEAQKRPWVTYFDPAPFFTDANGNYTLNLPSADGKVQAMRASDNIHLSLAGADRLAWAVYGQMKSQMDLSNELPAAPALSQLPPATIKPRTELPRPPDLPAI